MEDGTLLDRVLALRADAERARDRAHQRSRAADRLSERAAAARRDAERARERARQLYADQLGRRAVREFAQRTEGRPDVVIRRSPSGRPRPS